MSFEFIDQTSNLLLAFVAAMVMNPEAQTKAQQEIDTVLGIATLPTVSDVQRLPYVTNLIHELKRWWPVVPAGGCIRLPCVSCF
jgi:cytochrome P450